MMIEYVSQWSSAFEIPTFAPLLALSTRTLEKENYVSLDELSGAVA